MTNPDHQWIWTTSKGHVVDVVYVGAEPLAEDEEPWFPEGPGQREPRSYDLHNLTTGESVRVSTGVVYEPWNWADAISDKLHRWGWTDGTTTEPETCEHGLSANLCAGPMHYPEDM